jgi:hypothetical protein
MQAMAHRNERRAMSTEHRTSSNTKHNSTAQAQAQRIEKGAASSASPPPPWMCCVFWSVSQQGEFKNTTSTKINKKSMSKTFCKKVRKTHFFSRFFEAFSIALFGVSLHD